MLKEFNLFSLSTEDKEVIWLQFISILYRENVSGTKGLINLVEKDMRKTYGWKLNQQMQIRNMY